jgi:hypothetical protein
MSGHNTTTKMLRAASLLRTASNVRCFNTVAKYYDEHYQYPGNAPLADFVEVMVPKKKQLIQDTTVFKPSK